MDSKIIYASTPKENEKLPLQLLEKALPGRDHIVIFGAHIPTKGLLDRELDILLLSPSGIYIIELKYWKGKILNTLHNLQKSIRIQWPDGRVQDKNNPQLQASDQGRILRSDIDSKLIRDRSGGTRFRFKQPIVPAVFFTVKKSELEFTVDEARSSVPVYTMDTIRQLWENKPALYTEQELQSLINMFKIEEQKVEGNSFPEAIDEYRIEKLLFQRAHYSVYKAESEFGRKVFLKAHKIDPKLLKDQEQVLLDITKRDGFVSAKLEGNPYVLFHSNNFRFGQYICSVTMWQDHMTLEKIMKEKRSIADKIRILKEIFKAVISFHEAGVFHRDLHPRNIMMQSNGEIKCMNFDFSRIVGLRTVKQGMPDADSMYLAPELKPSEDALHQLDIDQHTDYYSFGFIAYEFLAGSKPYESDFKLSHLSLKEIHPEIDEELSFAIESLIHMTQSERDFGWKFLRDEWGI